jgi:hypothetical protein
LKSLLLKQAFCFSASVKTAASPYPTAPSLGEGKAKPPGQKPHYYTNGAVASSSHERASLFTSGDSASRTCW